MGVKDESDGKAILNYEAMGDRELIQRFSGGDLRAFEAFYRRYYQSLMRFIMSLCKEKSTAEDIVQDTFIRLMSLRIRFGLVKNIKSYLFSIAVNRCRDHFISQSKSIAYEDEVRTLPGEYSDHKEGRVDAYIALKMIDRLPDRQREVLLLRLQSDLSFKEIGEVLKISENSAKVNYFYALSTLRALMEGGER